MKLVNWIISNKIVVALPLLALTIAGVFVFTQSGVQARKTDRNTSESYPTPTIETADEDRANNQGAVASADAAPTKAEINSHTAKVVFQVDNMSCSGCIATIKSSLASYTGIKDIIVDIAGGVTEVYYDTREIKDVNPLAASISASGYPARVRQVLTADQIRKEEALAASRAKFYIASVNEWDIARSDFNTELAIARKRYEQAYGENVFASNQGEVLLNSIKTQVVSRLINEGIQMQEVRRAGYRVDPEIVEREFAQFLIRKNLDREGLKASLEKSGYPFDYFMKKFENRVLLRRYLDENVFTGADGELDRQNQYQAWFNNARVLSKITIYDLELKQLSQNPSSGGSCCPTNKS